MNREPVLKRRLTQAAVIVGLAAFTLLVRIPYLHIPLERDEGEYAYIAWRMDQGELPYRDVFDQKPPGTFLIYWLTMKTLGGSATDFHLAGTAFVIVEIVLVYLLALRYVRRWIALGGAMLGAWVTAGCVMQGYGANTETFGAPFIVLTVLLALWGRDHRSGALFFLSGLAVGVGSLMKQPIALFVLVPLLLAWRDYGRGADGTVSFIRPVLVGLGALTAWAPVLVWFTLAGGISDMVYCVILHNMDYAHGLPGSAVSFLVRSRFGRLAPAYGCLILLALWGGLRRGLSRGEDGWTLVVWMAVSVVVVTTGMRLFFHYFLMAAPAFLVAAIVAFEDLWRRIARLSWGPLVGTPLVLAVLFFPLAADVRYDGPGRGLFGFSLNLHYEPLFDASPQIARWVRDLTRPDETVLIFGSEPQVPYYAERRSATRHILFDPLFGPYKRAPQFQIEVQDDVKRLNPPVIVEFRLAGSLNLTPDSNLGLLNFMGELLDSHYVPVAGADVLSRQFGYYLGPVQLDRYMQPVMREARQLRASGRSYDEVQQFIERNKPMVLVYLRADLLQRLPRDWKQDVSSPPPGS